MRACLALASALALLLPSLAQAEEIRIGFAPPVDRDLAYHIEQQRPVAGQMARFTADRTLRFAKDGQGEGGYTLNITLRAIDTDAAGDGGEPYRAAFSPLVGVGLHFRLDAMGRIIALDNMTDVWAKVEARLRAMTASNAEGSARHRAATNVLTLFGAQSDEGRLALLAGEIQPLLLFASSALNDQRPRTLRTTAGSPLGRPVPVEGTVALVERKGAVLELTEKLAGQGALVEVHYRLSQSSGLVEEQHRTLVMGTRSLTETRTVKGLND
ncbi:hypothetical protein [Sphingobium aromaticiconvertens]|uniref:hypothetical protein n=1 Tax=Sphingobium aromaticiconvertens TaxID=365341 RepID=UPI003015B607